MSDPVEDGVRLLHRWLQSYDPYVSNDDLRVIVRNIIAPAVQAAEVTSWQDGFVKGQKQGERDGREWGAAAAVQAERERIRAGLVSLIRSVAWSDDDASDEAQVLAVIDGGSE